MKLLKFITPAKNLGTDDLRDSLLVFCAESVVGYSASYIIELAVSFHHTSLIIL
jgi:hypothetical protein